MFATQKHRSGLVCICLASLFSGATYLVSTRSQIDSHVTYALRLSSIFHREQCVLCNIVNLTENITEEFPCVRMQFEPSTPVCLYPVEKDIYISAQLNKTGKWEPKFVERFQEWLKDNPTSGIIDIGTNIGVYSLLAASMGREVLSVEPNIENIKRFKKAVQIGRLENKVTLLGNAIAGQPGVAKIIHNDTNQGGTKMEFLNVQNFQDPAYDDTNFYNKFIVLNDLAAFCKFTDAVMKIDVEGFEHQAFAQADLLFDTIVIHKVLMEWIFMKFPASSKDEDLVIDMIDFLIKRNYIPKDWNGVQLNHTVWKGWPFDVVWHRMNFSS